MKNIYVHIKHGSLQSLAPQDALAQFLSPFMLLQQGKVAPVIPGAKLIGEKLKKAVRLFHEDREHGYLLAWAQCIEAFVEIDCRANAQVSSRPDRYHPVRGKETIGKALAFIGDHFNEPITLGQIASFCCLSPSRLSAVFNACMHSSPIAYRNRLRINHAAEMITTTGSSIKEVAVACGFNSRAQFRVLFRRATGKSPQELRKANS